MSKEIIEVNAALVVQKPANEVFEAIADPAKMSNYFISSSSGRIEQGKDLIWKFPEIDTEFPIRTGQIEKDKYLTFFWKGMDGIETMVEINLTGRENNSTLVSVTEKSRFNDKDGINWLKGNTEGWANFLACLKAFMEYGINLRKGAFDLSEMKKSS